MTLFRLLLISIFLLVIQPCTRAYNLKQIANTDGLTNSSVLSLAQDRQGRMWFGTCDGLNLYDGTDVSLPTFAGSGTLSGNLIENIGMTADGTLWVQTNYGLDRIDRSSGQITGFSRFKGKYTLRTFRSDVLVIPEHNTMYLYRDRQRTFRPLRIDGVRRRHIIDVYISGDRLHLFTTEGIARYRLTDNGHTLGTRPDGRNKPMALRHCFSSEAGIFLVDTAGTLFRYHPDKGTATPLANLAKAIAARGSLSDVTCSGQTLFVAFQTNGVLKLTPHRGTYRTEDIGVSSGVFRLLKDRHQDIVWIATDGQGVYSYSEDRYSMQAVTYSRLGLNIAKPVRSIFLDSLNTLWMGTKGEGLIRIPDFSTSLPTDKMQAEVITTQGSGLLDNSVYAFAQSRRPLFWIGSDGGVNYYSYRTHRITPLPSPQAIRYVHAIYEESDTVMWMATVGTGIVRATIGGTADSPEITHVKRYTIDGGNFSSNYFFSLYAGHDRKLWFGNRGFGVYRLLGDRLQSVPLKNSYGTKTVGDVFAVATEGRTLWMGTGYGLIRQDEKGERAFTKADGMRNSTIHAILKGNGHTLWLTTNAGLIRLDTRTNNFQTFDQRNGLDVIEFSDGAAYRKGNLLFFGGINGMVVVSARPYSTDSHAYMPPVTLSALSIAGHRQNLPEFIRNDADGKTLTLQYDQNFFTVSFAAIDYLNANNYTYQYKIDNNEAGWIDNGTSNRISFTRMAPGQYTLYVKYKNHAAGQESRAYAFRISIRPPWYLTPAAKTVYSLMFILMAMAAAKVLVRRQRQKQKAIVSRLEQAHREEVYEEKLRFFTNITHEFCTPLTLIYGPCERVLEYWGADDYIKKYIRLIKQNAERLNALIQEIIDFRRIETGHRARQVQPTDVSRICADNVQAFAYLSEQNHIGLHTQITPDIQWNTDSAAFTKIVTNLVSNAFKYTPDGGTVSITLGINNEKQLQLTVYNTGKGIRKEDMAKVFSRYAVLNNVEDNATKGLSARNGLGMAICHSMVQMLEGVISIESEPERYARFIVQLPPLTPDITATDVTPETTQSRTQAEQPTPAADADSQYIPGRLNDTDTDRAKILIVDDNREILTLLTDLLTPYDTYTATGAEEAMEWLKQKTPDLIITDVMMPGTDGIEFTRQVKQNRHLAHMPIIVLSAKHTYRERIEGLEAGADVYIGKPFNLDYLKAVVARLLENRSRLKEYYNTAAAAYEYSNGQLMQKEDKELLAQTERFIDDNISNAELSPEDLAAHLCISTRALYRKFKDLQQATPKDFIKDYKIAFAAKLLATTTLTIQEVIFRCGFNNRSHFYKEFDKRYRMTPKDYRTQARQEAGQM